MQQGNFIKVRAIDQPRKAGQLSLKRQYPSRASVSVCARDDIRPVFQDATMVTAPLRPRDHRLSIV